MASIQNPSSLSAISSHAQEEEEEVMITAEEIEAMKKSIFKNAMERLWDDVLTEYKKPKTQELKITRSGDTILHLAVLSWDLEIVQQLVKLISDDNVSKILKLKNNKGDTVLHLAATMGYVKMCEYIVGSDPNLMGERNDDGETPLFLAARVGRKRAFLFLHSRCGSICDGTNGLPYWKRLDGETVLHCAINGEYFDLAYQIIQIYGDDLVNCNNDKGLSPLHILASKPNVFKSGNSLGRFDLLIYHYMLVDNPEDPTKYNCGDDANGAKNFDEENGSKFLPPPPNMYSRTISFISFYFFKLAMNILFGISALLHFSSRLYKIKYKKQKNIEATRLMEELIERASGREYDTYADHDLQTSIPTPNAAPDHPQETEATKGEEKIESPLLIAAKMGVIEMVEKLLDKFPLAIHDMNAEKKNIVLLAVENRQSHVYNLLLGRIDMLNLNVFEQLDNKGNSVLHLAATLGESRPWLIPGAALQMQSEIRWYKFVKYSAYSMGAPTSSVHYNKEGKTAKQVFSETHKDLVKEGGQWLTKTSQSCSVVAALIATVAFATAATVPGGLDSTTGAPKFATKPAFKAFAISSLIALCFSVTSVIMFLAILTSVYEERNFANDLPNKLIVALFSLVISIASMLVSFCVGQVFVLNNDLIYAAYPFYILTSLPVAFFILIQFPLIDMIKAARSDMPQRSYKLKAGAPVMNRLNNT